MQLPTAAQITEKRVQRFKHELAEVIRHQDITPFKSLMADFQTEYGSESEEIMAALLYMNQLEQPLFVREIKVKNIAPRRDDFRGDDRRRNDRFGDEKRPHRGRGEDRFADRGSRGDDRSAGRSSRPRGEDANMQTFRIDVGRADGVEPRNIVGAIANEGGISSRQIGQIKLYDDYSTVDLPKDMPKATVQHLKKVWVAGRMLNIKEI
jgi:ATP-dependent RNA helicase DeaD